MALNRIIDREIDAANPRTAARELPAGALSLRAAWGIAAAGAALYATAAAALSPLCLVLSPIPLAVFVGYPYLKRVTPLCHFGVGAGLGLAPLGGWLAAGPRALGEIGAGVAAPALLAAFTFLWVAGFDVIYATLDEAFDRERGVRSLPASLGRARALRVAALLHALAVGALVALHAAAPLAPAALPLLAAIALLLVFEHRSARNVDLAFFKINIVVGIAVFALVAVGVWARD
jgi:4-hydroxybenzoate polyprenyltransferase